MRNARIACIQIDTQADVPQRKFFGSAGACDRIAGRICLAAAVANPHNRRIVDLANAVNHKNDEEWDYAAKEKGAP